MNTTPSSRFRLRGGFTLTEVMVAGAIAAVILTAFLAGFSQQRRAFYHKNVQQELQQNVRTAMFYLQRDLRYAGSGMVMGPMNLDKWFGLDPTVKDIPWIVDGGANPDQLIIVGIAGEPVGGLSRRLLEGGTVMDIYVWSDTVLPYIPLAGDVLVLAGIEAVMVESVSGNTLTISRDPYTPGVGVHLVYPKDTELFLLNRVTYRVGMVEGTPSLLREDSRYTYESDADKVVADGIEDFQVSRSGNVVTIRLTGRSRKPIPGYTSPQGDNFLRYTMTSENRIRNTSPRLSIQGWPSDILIADYGPGPTPTVGPAPTATPTLPPGVTPTPAPTPVPTATPTPDPAQGNRPRPTNTPKPTNTPRPTNTPKPK